MNKYILAVLLGVLIALTIQSVYNARCMELGFDDAAVTLQRVYCHTHKENLKYQYMALEELELRDWLQQRQSDPRMKIIYPIKQT